MGNQVLLSWHPDQTISFLHFFEIMPKQSMMLPFLKWNFSNSRIMQGRRYEAVVTINRQMVATACEMFGLGALEELEESVVITIEDRAEKELLQHYIEIGLVKDIRIRPRVSPLESALRNAVRGIQGLETIRNSIVEIVDDPEEPSERAD